MAFQMNKNSSSEIRAFSSSPLPISKPPDYCEQEEKKEEVPKQDVVAEEFASD